VEQAVALGLTGLALTDHDGLSAVVRFATAARDLGLPTVLGAELGADVELPRTKTDRAIAARASIPTRPGGICRYWPAT
jgi:error-prone DNA polymerase